MTDNTIPDVSAQQVFSTAPLDREVYGCISDLLWAGRHLSWYCVSCFTSEGFKIEISQTYNDDSQGSVSSYSIKIWVFSEEEERQICLRHITLVERDLDTLFSLKEQHENVEAKRRLIEAEHELIVIESLDLGKHVDSCVMALCSRTER
jgi:hypothetical protein